jgi:hypothetical protein
MTAPWILLCVILFPIDLSYASQWHVESNIDPARNKIIQSATSANADGHSLTFYRKEDKSVWASFKLSAVSNDVFGSTAIKYQVDELSPYTIEDVLKSGFVLKNPKFIEWRIFHGEGPADRGSLRDIMEGRNIKFRYSLLARRDTTTAFNLGGVNQAISTALELPKEAPPVPIITKAQAEFFKKIVEDRYKLWSTVHCNKLVFHCELSTTINKDSQRFLDCIKKSAGGRCPY